MSCWAHFKFHPKQPSFKVHVWEIFDEASLDSKTFETFFDKIFEKLSDLYQEQGFDMDLEEVEDYAVSSQHSVVESEDSAGQKLIEDLNKAVSFNILDSNEERHRSFREQVKNLLFNQNGFVDWFQDALNYES